MKYQRAHVRLHQKYCSMSNRFEVIEKHFYLEHEVQGHLQFGWSAKCRLSPNRHTSKSRLSKFNRFGWIAKCVKLRLLVVENGRRFGCSSMATILWSTCKRLPKYWHFLNTADMKQLQKLCFSYSFILKIMAKDVDGLAVVRLYNNHYWHSNSCKKSGKNDDSQFKQ